MNRTLIAIALSVLAWSAIFGSLPTPAMASFQIESVVSDTIDAGDNSALVIDANGDPHLVFTEGAGDLKYARKTGAAWSFENIDVGVFGDGAALALGATGEPHVVYHQGSNLRVARRVGGVWTSYLVDSNVSITQVADIAINSQGQDVVVYKRGDGELIAATQDTGPAGGWVYSIVDTSVFDSANGLPSLAIDANDIVHVSYAGEVGYLQYAKGSGCGTPATCSWSIEIVDPSLYVNSLEARTSIAVDPAGNPHIAYGNLSRKLSFAKKQGGLWSLSVVDTSSGAGARYASLALDSQDLPRITARQSSGSPTGLKYAVQAMPGGPWTIALVDTGATKGYYSSLALDANDVAHVSYAISNGGATFDMRYAVEAVGTSVESGPRVDPAPSALLLRNVPNPFSPRTTIRYEIAVVQPVSIEIYDVAGRRVRSLLSEPAAGVGRREVEWDGRADNGDLLPSGVYVYSLRGEGGVRMRRMTLVR